MMPDIQWMPPEKGEKPLSFERMRKVARLDRRCEDLADKLTRESDPVRRWSLSRMLVEQTKALSALAGVVR
ncbi:hypothetical protein [Brytella acorum]|uniref:Uncharacterized protein n=1 Tax=Brytella acorum TaxID=2959299 RepID=A0AA35XWT1_9PROT|nr:hypothetical protein [Brytella acorum]CAI9119567.1 hypothetical protein LMG32879_000384 [Brytella acorum]